MDVLTTKIKKETTMIIEIVEIIGITGITETIETTEITKEVTEIMVEIITTLEIRTMVVDLIQKGMKEVETMKAIPLGKKEEMKKDSILRDFHKIPKAVVVEEIRVPHQEMIWIKRDKDKKDLV